MTRLAFALALLTAAALVALLGSQDVAGAPHTTPTPTYPVSGIIWTATPPVPRHVVYLAWVETGVME